jgi:hypothetical protein
MERGSPDATFPISTQPPKSLRNPAANIIISTIHAQCIILGPEKDLSLRRNRGVYIQCP